MTRFGCLGLLLVSTAALSGCDYDKNAVQEIAGPAPGARVKFFNFGVSAPAVNFYADGQKVTAISSTTGAESTLGVGYGGVGSGGLYAGLDPGQYTLTGRIAAAVDKDLPIASVAATLADGKAYSFYMSGIYNATTKTVDAFVVEDPFIPDIDWSVAYVRFVNAIFNANPMGLFVRNTVTNAESAIGSTVAYKSAGEFVAVAAGVYDLRTRYAGQAANVVSRTAVSFAAGRVYTITARGNITDAPTSTSTCPAATRTCLDNTLNR